jgi:hypothetical protein
MEGGALRRHDENQILQKEPRPTTAATGLAGARPSNRDHRQGADAPIGCLTIRRRRGPDLIPDFLDADLADLIQERNDVPMGRHHFGADRDLDIRIGGVQLKKPRQNLIILDKLPVEKNRVAGRHADRDVIFRNRSRRRTLGGQIYLNPFHVGLAQAHHHETGKKEKHDVNKRNDFDTCPLFWDR